MYSFSSIVMTKIRKQEEVGQVERMGKKNACIVLGKKFEGTVHF